jgi:signal transduction histidine kinase
MPGTGKGRTVKDVNTLRHLRERLAALPGWALDAGIVALLIVVDLSTYLGFDAAELMREGYTGPVYEGPLLGGAALVVAVSLPMVVRRRYPRAAYAASVVATAALLGLGVPALALAVLVGLYTVAALCDKRSSFVALGVAVLATVTWLALIDTNWAWYPAQMLILLTAWALGDRQRTRRVYTAELEERAERAERDRDDQTRLAVAEERSRIARELHDVVAHSVSVMVVQSSAARRLLERDDPERAAAALSLVEQMGRQSLVEMRRLLGLPRGRDEVADLAPLPSLEGLDDLVGQFVEAGLPVTVRVEGDARDLASGVDLSAYRIVQEALTNTLKHAEAVSKVGVSLRYRPDELVIEVEDDGARPKAVAGVANGHPGGPRGHGLVGMRERVALLGGRLEVGPGDGAGFTVRASLPLAER